MILGHLRGKLRTQLRSSTANPVAAILVQQQQQQGNQQRSALAAGALGVLAVALGVASDATPTRCDDSEKLNEVPFECPTSCTQQIRYRNNILLREFSFVSKKIILPKDFSRYQQKFFDE